MHINTFFFVSVLFLRSFASAAALPRDRHTLNKRLLDLDSLFEVKIIAEGSCDSRQGDLQTYVQESSDMIDAAIRVLNNYDDDLIGQNSLAVYLGVQRDEAYLEEELGAVSSMLLSVFSGF